VGVVVAGQPLACDAHRLAVVTGNGRHGEASGERREGDQAVQHDPSREPDLFVQGQLGPPHVGAGWRSISLDDFTFEELCRYIDVLHQEAKDFGPDYPRHGKLVVWPDGRLPHPDTITRRFNHLVDLAGVPKIELHDVRHVYITLSRDHGVNRKILADRVGHANESVTDAIYTHKSSGHDREMADEMGGLIRDAVKRIAPT
jgi:integrase